MWYNKGNNSDKEEIILKKVFWTIMAVLLLITVADSAFSNQIGVNFNKEGVGALGDYEWKVDTLDFAVDGQLQRSDSTSFIANASIRQNFSDKVGISPFISYNKDDLGLIADMGGVLNFSVGGLEIAAGASFRGTNPVADGGSDGFDADGNPIKYFTEDPSNTYSLPAEQNVNAVFKTGFEKYGIETGLTAYLPLTKRDVVPAVIISRSQISIELGGGLSLSVVLDGRTYVHAEGFEVSLAPQGALNYRFK